jgi:carbon storage regulator
MLVLSRQKDESIVIGDDGAIEIVIVDVRGDKVRLGITAPKEIPVHRREIYDAIQREKAEAKAAEGEAGEGKMAEAKPEKAAEKRPEEDPESHVEDEAAEPVVKKSSKSHTS